MLIDATCLYDADAALLRFTTKGFDSDVTLKAVMKNIAVTRLSRNGDLGADKPGCFEANGDALDTKQWSMRGDGESFARTDSLEFTANVNGKAAFEKNLKLLNEVANRIHFDTPDPYINAIDLCRWCRYRTMSPKNSFGIPVQRLSEHKPKAKTG